MKQIIKKISGLFLAVLGGILLLNFSNAQDERGKYGSDPLQILDEVAYQADKQGGAAYRIQETSLDHINVAPGLFRFTNTVERLRKNLNPYLQRAVYIGFVAATFLLVFWGLRLVTSGVDKSADMSKLKSLLVNVGIGLILLTGFYGIIQIIVALINAIVGNTTNLTL